MSWNTLSLHCKQTYEGGYRYLDRCGEFMLAAVEQMDFIPGETKPTGATMIIPDRGVNASVDAVNLAITQELPQEERSGFVDLCVGLTCLVAEHFDPKGTLRIGFASKSYWPFEDPRKMLSSSLTLGGLFHQDLARIVDMVPEYKKLDYAFVAGHKRFHVKLEPITFERVNLPLRNADFRTTRVERSRVDRSNRFAKRLPSLLHALVLELDLTEDEPAMSADLGQHLEELRQKTDELRKHFQIT